MTGLSSLIRSKRVLCGISRTIHLTSARLDAASPEDDLGYARDFKSESKIEGLGKQKDFSRFQRYVKNYVKSGTTSTVKEKRFYDEDADGIKRWYDLWQCNTAEEALNMLDNPIPTFLLLKVLRLRIGSRHTFYEMVMQYRAHRDDMDDSSTFYSLQTLIRHALRIDPDLLQLLEADLTHIPDSFTAFTFNRMLKLICSKQHPQVASMQSHIVREMEKRSHALNKEGYRALLQSCGFDDDRYRSILRSMGEAGFLPNQEFQTILQISHQSGLKVKTRYAETLAKITRDNTLAQNLAVLERSDLDIRSATLWQYLLVQTPSSPDTIRICIKLIEIGKVPMTTFFTALLFRACNAPSSYGFVERICRLAIAKEVVFDTFVWCEYVKRLLWRGHTRQVIQILTEEPGGNNLLDMSPEVRRDPRIWSATIHQLNRQVEQGRCTSHRHSKHMSQITQGLDLYQINMTPALLWCLMEAALHSGPRTWNGGHSCDYVAATFQANIDTGNEPWKLQVKAQVWQSYLKVLVANEELNLLQDAMMQMITLGMVPDARDLRLFAVGIWESGEVGLVQHWQNHFENTIGISWPTLQETFEHRAELERRDFRWFRT